MVIQSVNRYHVININSKNIQRAYCYDILYLLQIRCQDYLFMLLILKVRYQKYNILFEKKQNFYNFTIQVNKFGFLGMPFMSFLFVGNKYHLFWILSQNSIWFFNAIRQFLIRRFIIIFQIFP